MYKVEEQRFEFILYINNHIICQRYFNIRGYNHKSLKSLELKELMDDIMGTNIGQFGYMGIIPHYLKQRSKEYTWRYYNPYRVQTQEDIPTRNIYEKIDNFQFEIRVDKRCIAKGQFSGNYFPPKIRYDVNIRDLIPDIIKRIRDIMSMKKYTKSYASVEL